MPLTKKRPGDWPSPEDEPVYSLDDQVKQDILTVRRKTGSVWGFFAGVMRWLASVRFALHLSPNSRRVLGQMWSGNKKGHGPQGYDLFERGRKFPTSGRNMQGVLGASKHGDLWPSLKKRRK